MTVSNLKILGDMMSVGYRRQGWHRPLVGRVGVSPCRGGVAPSDVGSDSDQGRMMGNVSSDFNFRDRMLIFMITIVLSITATMICYLSSVVSHSLELHACTACYCMQAINVRVFISQSCRELQEKPHNLAVKRCICKTLVGALQPNRSICAHTKGKASGFRDERLSLYDLH